jgi:hypothetical protein
MARRTFASALGATVVRRYSRAAAPDGPCERQGKTVTIDERS